MSNFKKYMSIIQESESNKNVLKYTNKEGVTFKIETRNDGKIGYVDQTHYITTEQGPINPPVLTRVSFNQAGGENFKFKDVADNEKTSLEVFMHTYSLSRQDIINMKELIKSSFEK